MSKHYKVEPPPIVRQMWEAGLRVLSRDSSGHIAGYDHCDLSKDLGRDCWPPSWIKELEHEQITVELVKEGAPVEMNDGHGGIWASGFFIGCVKGCVVAVDDIQDHPTQGVVWEEWRIPANMDPEAWKREWLVPEKEECRNCGPEDGMDCPNCNGTGEVNHE